MKKMISIEYCTSWGYISRAVALSEKLLSTYKNNLEMIQIIPSTGGVFEVKLDNELLFSKKELGRFPEDNEVEMIVLDKM